MKNTEFILYDELGMSWTPHLLRPGKKLQGVSHCTCSLYSHNRIWNFRRNKYLSHTHQYLQSIILVVEIVLQWVSCHPTFLSTKAQAKSFRVGTERGSVTSTVTDSLTNPICMLNVNSPILPPPSSAITRRYGCPRPGWLESSKDA